MPASPSSVSHEYLDLWVVNEAWRLETPSQLVAELSRRLREAGIPVERVNCFIPFLDPQSVGVAYQWLRSTSSVTEVVVPFEMRQMPTFLDSPTAEIVLGRRRLIRSHLAVEDERNFPIFDDLRAAGMTGYLTLAVPFSDGAINAASFATAKPGGFSDADVATIDRLLVPLGRILENHALRRAAVALLDTYVGRGAGSRILKGQIRRGDLTTIDSIIWFSDLRDSTRLGATLPPQDYIAALNAFFDATAGCVLSAGGEVLKFIGDAVLAIFPTDSGAAGAASTAVTAARAALDELAAINDARSNAGRPSLSCGISLHRGEVLYGNVGVPSRLDFTVTGAAVNVAARIQELCKSLGQTVLASGDVAHLAPGNFALAGRRTLRGVGEETEIWRLLKHR